MKTTKIWIANYAIPIPDWLFKLIVITQIPCRATCSNKIWIWLGETPIGD